MTIHRAAARRIRLTDPAAPRTLCTCMEFSAKRHMGRLDGFEVCITGRLASMSRAEAVRRIEQSGGRFVSCPTRSTSWVVVGRDGPPLGDDGRLTRALRVTRDLAESGVEIEVVQEHELLARLTANDAGDGLDRLYTLEQLGRILGTSKSTLRGWVRRGLLHPRRTVHRLHLFDFRQVATARALCRFVDRGVTAERIRESLEELRRWMPDTENAIQQLEQIERRGPLLVRLEDGALAEPSGQLRLDFGGAAAAPVPVRQHPGRVEEEVDWFQCAAVAEEEDRFEDALDAYTREIARAGDCAELRFNMGNVYYALQRLVEATESYRAAVAMDGEYVEAWNNLGNVLADRGLGPDAILAYRRALAIEPAYPDAHFNLADTLVIAGKPEEARRHWMAYLSLDPDSPWADRVRERLSRGS